MSLPGIRETFKVKSDFLFTQRVCLLCIAYFFLLRFDERAESSALWFFAKSAPFRLFLNCSEAHNKPSSSKSLMEYFFS